VVVVQVQSVLQMVLLAQRILVVVEEELVVLVMVQLVEVMVVVVAPVFVLFAMQVLNEVQAAQLLVVADIPIIHSLAAEHLQHKEQTWH
jgi:hypothetical protein